MTRKSDTVRHASRSSGCGSASRSSCGTRSGGPIESLADIVEDYLEHEAHHVLKEARHFGDKSLSFDAAVALAACSVADDEKLHSHQRRLGYERMRSCASLLAGHHPSLAYAADFAQLHQTVEGLLRPLEGVGDLAIYDIAERIGWYRDLEPDEVYLHAGAGEGARALLPDHRSDRLRISDLPEELRRLSAAHVENLLCMYKAKIKELWRTGRL